jgi:hypothetical protein
MPLPVTSATPAMETTAMGTASKTRPPAGGKASCIPAVIKAAERAGARTWLSVKRGAPTSVEGIAVVEVVAAEVVAAEVVATDDRSAVGDVGVVVIDH